MLYMRKKGEFKVKDDAGKFCFLRNRNSYTIKETFNEAEKSAAETTIMKIPHNIKVPRVFVSFL